MTAYGFSVDLADKSGRSGSGPTIPSSSTDLFTSAEKFHEGSVL